MSNSQKHFSSDKIATAVFNAFSLPTDILMNKYEKHIQTKHINLLLSNSSTKPPSTHITIPKPVNNNSIFCNKHLASNQPDTIQILSCTTGPDSPYHHNNLPTQASPKSCKHSHTCSTQHLSNHIPHHNISHSAKHSTPANTCTVKAQPVLSHKPNHSTVNNNTPQNSCLSQQTHTIPNNTAKPTPALLPKPNKSKNTHHNNNTPVSSPLSSPDLENEDSIDKHSRSRCTIAPPVSYEPVILSEEKQKELDKLFPLSFHPLPAKKKYQNYKNNNFSSTSQNAPSKPSPSSIPAITTIPITKEPDINNIIPSLLNLSVSPPPELNFTFSSTKKPESATFCSTVAKTTVKTSDIITNCESVQFSKNKLLQSRFKTLPLTQEDYLKYYEQFSEQINSPPIMPNNPVDIINANLIDYAPPNIRIFVTSFNYKKYDSASEFAKKLLQFYYCPHPLILFSHSQEGCNFTSFDPRLELRLCLSFHANFSWNKMPACAFPDTKSTDKLLCKIMFPSPNPAYYNDICAFSQNILLYYHTHKTNNPYGLYLLLFQVIPKSFHDLFKLYLRLTLHAKHTVYHVLSHISFIENKLVNRLSFTNLDHYHNIRIANFYCTCSFCFLCFEPLLTDKKIDFYNIPDLDFED